MITERADGQPQHVLVAPREMFDFAEVEAFTGRIGRAEQALHTAAQVLRADKQRLGGFVPQFDQANCLAG